MYNSSSFYLLVGGLILFAAVALLIYSTHRPNTEVDVRVQYSPHYIDKLVASIFSRTRANIMDSQT